MINKNKEERGSIKKEKGMDNFPAVIHENKSTVTDFSVCPINSKNIPKDKAKAPKIDPQPMIPTDPLDNVFPNNPIITKPIKGSNGIK